METYAASGYVGHQLVAHLVTSGRPVVALGRRVDPLPATAVKGEVQVVELRAAVVIGAGSISFEILRYLTERCP